MFRNNLAKIVLGTAAILIPAVMPDIPIFNTSKVYAEEKKPDFLEQKIHSEINRLKKKEDKTVDEYLRLVDLSYDFEKDKVLALIEETKKNIDQDTPQHNYLDVLKLWLTKPQDKSNPAISLHTKITRDKKTSSRTKSNLYRKIGVIDKIFYIPLSVKKDNTNLAAHLDLLSYYFNDNILNFKSSFRAEQKGKGYFEQLDEKVQECIKAYNFACKQFNKNKDLPETPYYTAKIHEIMIKTLKSGFKKQKKFLEDYFTSYNYGKDYVKKTNKCYDALINVHPTYENYMGKGFLNYDLRTQTVVETQDIKRYDDAEKAFGSAAKLAITDEQKGTALYYQGKCLIDKAYYADIRKWKFFRSKRLRINGIQKGLAKRALKIFKSGMEFYNPEQKRKVYSMIDGIKERLAD